MRKKIHQWIFWYTCLALAFMLPVWGKLLPTIIVILILNWLVAGEYVHTTSKLLKEKNRRNTLMFGGLYVLYLLGLFYTTDFTYAWFDLEVKLSLLVFPLIFATSDLSFLDKKYIRQLMLVYLAGCFTGTMLLLGHACYLWKEGVDGAFYYMKLSWFFHSGYIAMYLNFAMGFMTLELLWGFHGIHQWVKGIYYFLLSWFFIFILLLSSKMGLITLVLIALLSSSELIFRRKKMLQGLGLIILFLMVVRAGLHVFPKASERVVQSREAIASSPAQETGNSTSDRINIWKVSLGIIKSNLLIGVGTGDVKDILIAKYKENNIAHALEYKLNAHNQYLQTFMTLGLPGIISLLLMLFLPMLAAFRRGYFLYFLFLGMFSINIFVESMFETQAGVIWYAFFNILLFSAADRSGCGEKTG